MTYDPAANSKASYDLAISEMRRRHEAKDIPAKRVEFIGDCTLYLGDSRLIAPHIENVSAIITDPPYGMGFRSNFREEKHEAIANDEDTECLMWACSLPAAHSKYIFCRWDNLGQVLKPKSCITWVKNNWSMGDLDHEHARQTELVLFYPGPDHAFPAQRPQDVVRAPRTGNDNHPTEKPVQLMMAIAEWTSGLVLDPFMGSGSTGVACARLGRAFVGIEINEEYFDTACRRIQDALREPDMFVRSAQC